MVKMQDIYNKPTRPEEGPAPSAPAGPPPEMRPPHRLALVVIILMALLMAGVAIYFSMLESKDGAGEFDHLLIRPPAATNLIVKDDAPAAPDIVAIESLLADLGTGSQLPPSAISPQKMAAAMSYVRSAQEYIRERDMDSAEREIGNALAVWPDMNLAVRLLGSIYTQRGQFDQAIILLERSLAKDPFNAETLNNLAINYIQKNMMSQAEELLMTSLQVRPDYSVAYLNLGFVHLRLNRYDLAAENFELGLRQIPGSPGIMNNLAVCHIRLGDHERARRNLLEIIEQYPDRPIAYFNLAISYVLQRDETTAIEWIRRGAEKCSPSQLQSFLSDSDFDPVRPLPEFQQIILDRFPDIPARRPSP